MLKNTAGRAKKILKGKRGFIEILAIILIVVFVVLKIATPVKDVGDTSKQAVENLDNQLKVELGVD